MSPGGISPEQAQSSFEAKESPSHPTVTGSAVDVRVARESLWKRSKRTLGNTQFAFLQGKVASDASGGDNNENKSHVFSSKRREQVRRAQRTHRQRTEAYVKTLEDEVVRLRKSEARTTRKNSELQAELDALQQSIENGTHYNINLSPAQSSVYPYSSYAPSTQLSHPSSTITVSDSMALDVAVGVSLNEDAAGNLALETKNHYGHHATSLPPFRKSAFEALGMSEMDLTATGNECSGHEIPPPPPPKNKDRIVLVTDDYQTGIDFVLLLEQPCIRHIHPYRAISPEADPNTSARTKLSSKSQSLSDSASSTGHVLTASASLLNAYSSPASNSSSDGTYANWDDHTEIPPGSTWTVSAHDIERLLYLSSNLQLRGEITPVEAWRRLRLHPGFGSLSRETFEELTGDLKELVACYGFGAVLDESTFHDTMHRLLSSEDAAS